MKDQWVRLPERWSKFVQGQPETGMDYQVVDLTLADGPTVCDVAIIGSTIIAEIKDLGIVRELAELPFDPEQIVDITVTHKKWNFRR